MKKTFICYYYCYCFLLCFLRRLDANPYLVQDPTCPILALLDFSDTADDDSASPVAYSYLAAVQMALEHFNTRNPVVVPEFATLGECTVVLSDLLVQDTANDAATSLKAYQQVTSSSSSPLCSLIGHMENLRPLVALDVSAEMDQVPLIMTSKPTRAMYDNLQFVLTTRFPVRYLARALADYLAALHPEPRRFVVLLFDNHEFDADFQARAQDELDLDVNSESIVGQEDAIQNAIDEIQEEGYNTVVVDTTDPTLLPQIAETAHTIHGLLERPILWVLAATALPSLDTLEIAIDSPLDKLLTGAVIYADYDPFLFAQDDYDYDYDDDDKFATSWKAQNATHVTKLNQIAPAMLTPMDKNYFDTTPPSVYASFLYDAVALTGLAACQLQRAQKGAVIEDDNDDLLLDQMLQTNFDGASGVFSFGNDEESSGDDQQTDEIVKTRSPTGRKYGIYNIRSQATGKGTKRYFTVLTSIFEDGAWRNIEGVQFIYSNGTPNPPNPVRVTFDHNYLEHNIFVLGMAIISLSFVISLGSLVCVYKFRQVPAVAAGQPPFLYLLCLGAAVCNSSAIFVSFDENMGYSEETLSQFCSIVPWLFVIGYVIIYCALVGKLWRMNKIFNNPLRRQRVQAYEALWPFTIVLGCAMTLICWHVLDPLTWTRNEVQEEPYETAGNCSSENSKPYLLSLGILIVIATGLTLFQSWQARNIQSEFSESKWIFAGAFSHVQLWLVGVPVYVIMNEEGGAFAYMIKVAFVFLLSTAMVVLVVWPKICLYYFPAAKPQVSVNISSGAGNVRVSGLDSGEEGRGENDNMGEQAIVP